MLSDTPTFEAKQQLVRYIDHDYRLASRRAKVSAFMEDEHAKKNGLSVNSLEVHTENQIAAIYAQKFSDSRPVAISIHSVEDYNDAAKSAGLLVFQDESRPPRWMHEVNAGSEQSYIHDSKKGNESHCLVRFTTLFEHLRSLKFARRMAFKPLFKFV